MCMHTPFLLSLFVNFSIIIDQTNNHIKIIYRNIIPHTVGEQQGKQQHSNNPINNGLSTGCSRWHDYNGSCCWSFCGLLIQNKEINESKKRGNGRESD